MVSSFFYLDAVREEVYSEDRNCSTQQSKVKGERLSRNAKKWNYDPSFLPERRCNLLKNKSLVFGND